MIKKSSKRLINFTDPGSHDGTMNPKKRITLSFRAKIVESARDAPSQKALDYDISFGKDSSIDLSNDSSSAS